jgi:hypothetical protein
MIKPYIPKQLTRNELKKYATYQDGALMQYIDDSMKNDINFLKEVLNICPKAYFFLPEHLQQHRDIFTFMATTNMYYALELHDETLKNDKDFLLNLLKNHSNGLSDDNYYPQPYENFFKDKDVMTHIILDTPSAIQFSELKHDREYIIEYLKLDVDKMAQFRKRYIFNFLSEELQSDITFIMRCLDITGYDDAFLTTLPINLFYTKELSQKIKNLLTQQQLDWDNFFYGFQEHQSDEKMGQMCLFYINEGIMDRSNVPYDVRYQPCMNIYFPEFANQSKDSENEEDFFSCNDDIDEIENVPDYMHEWLNLLQQKYYNEFSVEDKNFLVFLIQDFNEKKEQSVFKQFFYGQYFFHQLDEVAYIFEHLYAPETGQETLAELIETQANMVCFLDNNFFILYEKGCFCLYKHDGYFAGATEHLHEMAWLYLQWHDGEHIEEKLEAYTTICEQLGLQFNRKKVGAIYQEKTQFVKDSKEKDANQKEQRKLNKMNLFLFSLLSLKRVFEADLKKYLPTLYNIEKYYLNDSITFEYLGQYFMLQNNKYVFKFTDEGLKAETIGLHNLPIQFEEKINPEINEMARRLGLYCHVQAVRYLGGDGHLGNEFWEGYVFSNRKN